MPRNLEKLVKDVVAIQESRDWSDAEMAGQLDVSTSLWNKTRRGQRPLSEAVLSGIVKAFPQLQPDVLIFLGRRSPKVPAA